MPRTEHRHPSHRITTPPGRAAEYMAREILRSRGYTVIRSASQDSLVHLVAWKEREPALFVRVRRSRRPVRDAADLLARWPEDVRQLRFILRNMSGSLQLWVYSGWHGWRFYEVLPGGVAEVGI